MTNAQATLSSLGDSDKKLVFVGGKGGVGKSTVSAAIAFHLSRQFNTLLISTDPAHSTGDSFGSQEFGSKTKIDLPCQNLTVWELDSAEAFNDFKSRHDKEIRLLFDTSTYLEEEDVDQMMSLMVPGIDEVMGLKTIIDIIEEGSYEKIIVDTAPTGHALRLLFMHDTLNLWVRTMANMRWKYKMIQKTFKGKYTPDDADDMLMDLKRMVSRMKNLLGDDQQCEFILVSQPMKMILSETRRLHTELTEHHIAVNTLIMNGLFPESIDPFYHKIHAKQLEQINEFKTPFKELTTVEMPHFPEEITGVDRIADFESKLFRS